MNKDDEDFFRKVYLSLYLKGVACERDRAELQYIDPHSYGHQHCVFLALQGCSTGGLVAYSAGFLYCILSLTHLLSLSYLVSNFSDLQLNRGSQMPLLPGGGFPYHIFSPTRLNSNSLTSCLHRVI